LPEWQGFESERAIVFLFPEYFVTENTVRKGKYLILIEYILYSLSI